MSWANILNHQAVVDRFRQSLDRNRLASTYLFVGLPGIGKRLFAHQLAEVLLCENPPQTFESCGTCPACQQVRAQTHPDLILISKPADKAFIPIDTFIGEKDHRHQSGLCHDIGLKPFRGGCKVAIVDDADHLNLEGANCLLKTLEEPPPKSLLILIGSSEQRQLPTIVSRSQVIRFHPLSTEQVKSILQQIPDFESQVPLEQLAAASQGSVELAIQLADKETFDFRTELFAQLASCDPGQEDFAKIVTAFVDAAGKDGAKKRARLSLVADFAIQFFRACYLQRSEVGNQPPVDVSFGESVQTMAQRWQETGGEQAMEIAAAAIERCDELQRQIHANVNQANAVEAWLIDLGKICRGSDLARI
jgi:DNA polymerase-3 subunit delta'